MKKPFITLAFIFCAPHFLFSQVEDCGNGIDDDGDGFIDCLDPDCSSGSVPTGTLFNTATNGIGGVLPGGSNDLNWQISTGSISGPYTPAIVMSSTPGSYYTSPWPDCDWISHNASGTHSVNTEYYYKIAFYLPCTTPCGASFADSATFCLNMDFYADNSVYEVFVNGIPQSAELPAVPPPTDPYYYVGFAAGSGLSLQLCDDWVPGLNELIIQVNSGPGYAGFLAQNSVSAPPTVGDPTILSPFTNYTTCLSSSPINYTATSAGGVWSASCGTCIDPTTGVFDPAVAGVGTFTVTYTLTVPCYVVDTALINVVSLADASITNPGTICTNQTPFNLVAATSGGTWAGTGITNTLNGTFNSSISGPGTFLITYTISGSCNDTDSIYLNVNELNASGSALNETCYNSEDGSIAVTASSSGSITYFLSGPENATNTTGNFTSLADGNYTVIISSTSGCNDTLFYTISSPAEIFASFTASPTSGFAPLDVTFTNGSTNATSFEWNLGNGTNTTTTNTSATYNNLGNYTVTLYAYNGSCVDSFSLTIEVTLPSELIVYNIFSPNNDLVNDEFYTTYKNLSSFHLTIYDRWGLLMFETTNPDKGWNGKNKNGQACAEGTYYYVVKAVGIDEKSYEFHGNLNLVRTK